MDNYFTQLNAIDVNGYVERKGDFAYLSWPYAVQQLSLADPTAIWEVRRFDGLPYLKTETGFFVEVSVTVQGVNLTQIHPAAPTCFEVNTSIQRALVKAIALHGLGLSVYAGEDLPENGKTQNQAAHARTSTVSQLPVPSPASQSQLRYIRRLIEETGSEVKKVLDYFGVSTLEELTSRAASRAIKSLEKTRRTA